MAQWHHIKHTAPSGNSIHAEISKGNGPSFILVPGTWGNAQTRPPLIEHLNPNINLICVSLAGQDDNWPPPQTPSISQFSEDIISLADTLGLEQFYVGGNSLGGMIAIDMLQYGPNRILGAIAIEGWTHHSVSKSAFQSDTSSTLNHTQRTYLQHVRNKLLNRWEPNLKTTYSTMWKKWDGWQILNTTQIPVLEIWGDRARPQPSLEQMHIPNRKNIQLAWIPNTSHNLLLEAPEQLAQLINHFTQHP
jgi:pimeloyl-ACP methyl ester carboxylesterase